MKLSIITINYNNLEGLKKTAESVINQTWRDFEWIIVDGGSTDGSKEYIEQLAAELSSSWTVEQFSMPGFSAADFPLEEVKAPSLLNRDGERLFLWCSEPDKGIYNAMNKGIAKASGDYLNFMNSGDCFYENETLEKAKEFLDKGEADVYIGNFQVNNGDKLIEKICYHNSIDLFDITYKKLCHQAMFIRTSLLKDKGYDESYNIAADFARNVEFVFANKIITHIDHFVCIYDNTGISSNKESKTGVEFNRVVSDLIPNGVFLSLGRLYAFENGHIYNRVNNILRKKGVSAFLLKLYLKICG